MLGRKADRPWNEESSVDKHGAGEPAALRVDDPWQDAAATGPWVPQETAPRPEVRDAADEAETAQDDRAAVYLDVQHSAAFQEVRARYRRFAFPAVTAFVVWYLLYVVAATTAPRLMAHRVAGELNVAMVAGLAQFATTFALTWAYARHARTRRDRLALDLRWSLATGSGRERVR
jgi:uncharacterized membrane protein (DUF485 family)